MCWRERVRVFGVLNLRETCTKECLKHHGVWEKDTNTCFVEMYLSSMCFRLIYVNETDLWSLDLPP